MMNVSATKTRRPNSDSYANSSISMICSDFLFSFLFKVGVSVVVVADVCGATVAQFGVLPV